MQKLQKPKLEKTAYTGLVILESLLWGVGNPVMKIGLGTLPPFWLLTLRFALGFFLFALFFGRNALKQINRGNIVGIVISALLNAAAYILSTFTLMLTATTIAGFLMSLAVLFTPFLGFVFLRQRLDWRNLPIVGVVVVGMYLMCGAGGSFSFGVGEVLGVVSSLCFAGALTLTSRFVKDVGAASMSCIQVGVMMLTCLVFALFLEDASVIAATPPVGWATIVYLGLGCTFAAYLMQNKALGHVSAVVVSLAFCSEPVFTAIASYLMLGEKLSLTGYIGAALITAGIVLTSLVQMRDEKLAAARAAEPM